jgi:hypothetical protein
LRFTPYVLRQTPRDPKEPKEKGFTAAEQAVIKERVNLIKKGSGTVWQSAWPAL